MSLPSAEEITNRYLYGQPTKPTDMTAESLIRPSTDTTSVSVNVNDYMAGPGRFAAAAKFEIVDKFLNPSLHAASYAIAPGTYTKTQIHAALGITKIEQKILSVDQSLYDDGQDDFLERAYIWNTTAFNVNEAKFVVEQNGNRYIDNFALEPYTQGSNPENFDFSAGSFFGNRVNSVLEPKVDPSKIGRRVNVNFIGTRNVTRFTYTDFVLSSQSTRPDLTLYARIINEADAFLDRLWSSGATRFLDNEGRTLIYGTTDADQLSTSKLDPPLMRADIDSRLRTAINTKGVALVAGADNDVLTATDKNDALYGGTGNDTLKGEAGDDKLEGAVGNDSLLGGAGKDTLNGGEGDDTLDGGTENDILKGEADNDTLKGDKGNDTLEGGEGNDTLEGGSENDVLKGGSGDDKLKGDDGNDSLEGGTGKDDLKGGAGADSLNGEDGADTLDGGEGEDTLIGGKDNDSLVGGNGNDTLWGSSLSFDADGADTLEGGVGMDIYRASAGDTISDSDGSGIVRLRQRYIDGAWRKKGESVYHSWDNKFSFTVNGSTLIVSGGEGALTIKNWGNGQLDIRLSETEKKLPTKPPLDPNRTRALPIDPLVLDLNHDGLINSIGSLESSVFFDFNQDGIAERTGWVAAEDGILVSDENNNGVVDNLGELFGNAKEDGFASLQRRFDDNQDGVVNHFDAKFNQLLVWQDANQDGISQAGELKTLDQLGISAISIAAQKVNLPSKDNRVIAHGEFVQDGQTRLAADIELAVDFAITDSNPSRPLDEDVALDDEVLQLPRLRGFGIVRDFSYAAQSDLTLRSRAQQLLAAGSTALEDQFESLVAQWTGLNAARAARGMFPNQGTLSTAEKVWILETLEGVNFSKTVIENAGFSTPFRMRFDEQYIAERFRFITDRMELSFATQAYAKDWLDGVFYSVDQDRFDAFEPARANDSLANKLQQAQSYDETVSMARMIARLRDDGVALDIERLRSISLTLLYPEPIAYALDGGVILGGRGNDVLAGLNERNDWLDGNRGADLLRGLKGNDLLHGGLGNDTLEGGAGNDTYVYDKGDGDDRISDADEGVADSIDTLRLGSGISPSRTHARRFNDDLILQFGEDNDSITIVNYFHADASRSFQIEKIAFAQGEVWDVPRVKDLVQIATANNDFLYGYQNTNDVLNGLAGNDVIDGRQGDDTLSGGTGNDTLEGGGGADVFLFNLGDGHDVVHDYETVATTTLRLGAGISVAQTVATRNVQDLILKFGDDANSVTVRDYFYRDATGGNQISNIVFADGTTWNVDNVIALVGNTGAGNDVVYGYSTAESISGLAGNDSITSYAGNDTLIGGTGDDTLVGGVGSDVYLFARGDGRDLLRDHDEWRGAGDSDELRLGLDIAVNQTKARRVGNDLLLDFGQNDSVQIGDYFANDVKGASIIESIRFADGTQWDTNIIKQLVLQATEQDDVLLGYDSSDDAINGGAGNDSLRGQNGNDSLYGGTGNDQLEGGFGNDLLTGGTGDDGLVGGAGNDVYTYAVGDGKDVITDSSSTENDELRLGAGISIANTVAKRNYNDLVLNFSNSGGNDKITILNYFGQDATDGNQIERIIFANGDVWDIPAIKQLVLQASAEDDQISGYESADQINGLAGNDRLFGNGGNDTLIGALGLDTMDGGSGNDVLDAGAGDDALEGGAGNDMLDGGEGQDQVSGGMGDDMLDGGAGNDTLGGGDGNDTYLFGYGSGQDLISSYDQAALDVLSFKAGVNVSDVRITRENDDLIASLKNSSDSIHIDRFFRDEVNSPYRLNRFVFADGSQWDIAQIKAQALLPTDAADRLYGYASDDQITGAAGNDSLYGGNGNDVLQGESDDDQLFGQAGNDSLSGGSGNDLLEAGDGDDVLIASAGNDSLFGGNGNDHYVIEGQAAEVWINDQAGVDVLSLPADGKQLIVRRVGSEMQIKTANNAQLIHVAGQFNSSVGDTSTLGVEAITLNNGVVWDTTTIKAMALLATDLDDVIEGHSDDDTIFGANGNDIIHGMNGNDSLRGDEGNDALFGADGNDLLDGGLGADTLQGGWGEDSLQAGDGDDQLDGGEGNDLLHADAGNDSLIGGGGEDSLYGGLGADQLDGSDGQDSLFGEDDDDSLVGGAGDDLLNGGAGNDELVGNDGADTLQGGAGDDTLIAADTVWQRDSNVLEGGSGNDTIYGSYGDEVYGFNLGDGKDLIIETKPDQAFNNLDASQDRLQFGPGILPADIRYLRIGSDLVIRHTNGNDEITVQNWFGNIATEHFKLDRIEFADGSSLDIAGIEAQVLTLGTEQADTLSGYRNNADLIRSGAGNDKLFGFSGNDRLYGEDGDDVLMGGNGIASQTGNDSLFGGAGNDNLFGEDGDDSLDGESGNDYLDGGYGNDVLRGGSDNDQLTGGAGNDQLFGDAGDDKYVYQAGQGQDVIDNRGGGNDGVFPGVPLERISFSRDGDDLLITIDKDASQSLRVLKHFLGADNAISYVQPSTGFMLDATRIKQIIAAGEFGGLYDLVMDGSSNADNISGSSGKDLIRGLAGADQLFGLDGNDALQGGEGNDYLDGGAANDTLEGGLGDDQLSGGTGDDRLLAGAGNDKYVFVGNWGNDLIDNLGGGSDWLFFSDLERAQLGFKQDGKDLVIGVVGDSSRSVRVLNHFNDGEAAIAYVQPKSGNALSKAEIASLLGGGGTPPPVGTSGNDNLTGSANADTISAGAGNDTVFGAAGNDSLLGEAGDDYLDGGAGNDTLDGGIGKDQLQGGTGDDKLIGGQDDDKYAFSGSWGNDVIDNSGGGSDWLFFTEQERSELSLSKDGQDLLIGVVGDSSRSVRVLNHFAGASIAYLQAKSGNALSSTEIAAIISAGSGGNNGGNNGGGSSPANPADFAKVIDGDAGDNQLVGGNGKDLLRGLAGADQLFGGPGNDRLEGGDDNDYLSGGFGSGNSGDDLLIGGAGDDTLNGEDGNDRLEGGSGNDSYSFDGASQDVIDNTGGGNDGIFLADGIGANRLSFQRDGDDLLVLVDKSANTSIRVLKHFTGGAMAISYVQPSGGNMISAATIAQIIAAQNIPGGYETLQDGDAGNNKLTGAATRDLLRGLAGNDTLFGGLGNDKLEGNEGNDYLAGGYGNVANTGDDILLGGAGLDTLVGEDGNDTLDGGTEADKLIGGSGNDSYIIDNTGDLITENLNEGYDQVQSSVTLTLANQVEALFLSGTSNLNGNGNALDNFIFGNAGVNALNGAAGNDILQGAAGADTLTDTSGNNLLNGGADADILVGGTGKEMLIGGTGNDTITTSTGADVLAFNRGDGQDIVNASTGKDNTLSLGGGITYADLLFKKSANDLILSTAGASGTEQITFKDWYANVNNRSVANLQVVIEGTSDYNASSTNKLNNKKVEQFNFDGLVTAFDQARTAKPSITSWALSSSLLNFYLSSSDTAAIGGDLAYQYGKTGNLANLSATPAIAQLASPNFGSAAQNLQQVSSLQDLTPRLA